MSLIQGRRNILRQMGANVESDRRAASKMQRDLERYAGDLYRNYVKENVPSLLSAVSALGNTADNLGMLAVELHDIAKQVEAYERQLGM